MEILRYENNYTNIKIKYKQNKNDKKHVQHKLLHNPVVEVCVSKRFQPLHLYWHPSEVRFWMTSHWVYETSIVVHFVSHLHTHSFQYLTVHLSDIHLLSLYYRLTRCCFFFYCYQLSLLSDICLAVNSSILDKHCLKYMCNCYINWLFCGFNLHSSQYCACIVTVRGKIHP